MIEEGLLAPVNRISYCSPSRVQIIQGTGYYTHVYISVLLCPAELTVPAVRRVGPADVVEILGRVRAGTTPPYRPEVSRDLVDQTQFEMMRQCWEELPHHRPDAATLKRQLARTVK